MDEDPTDRPRRSRRVTRILATVLVAALVLAALVWAVGVEAVHEAVGAVGPGAAALLAATGLVPVVVWGVELRVVLEGVGETVGIVRAVELFAASGFLNNVTPLGELGGDAPSGLLVAADRGTSFERGLAAITATNVLNRVAVLALGVAAVPWLAPIAGEHGIWWSLGVAAAAWAALAATAGAAWAARTRLLRRFGPPIASTVARAGRLMPLVSAPEPSSVQARLRGFVAAIARLARAPRRLGLALLLGAVGHLSAAAALWVAGWSLGVRLPVPDVLVVLVLAKSSGLSPTPGGAGSAVLVLSGLLTALAGVPPATAAATAILYRAGAFWVPTAVGGAVAVRLVAKTRPGGRETASGCQDSRR